MRSAARPNLLSGEDLPPQPVQKRSAEKRTRIKAAGLAVFGEKGFTGASMEELARRAGLAVGGVYLHFRSKRQLLLVLMDDLLEGLSRLSLAPDLAGDVQKGIAGLLSAAFSRDLKYLGAYRAWQEAVLSDPDLAARQREIRRWTARRVAALIGQLQRLPGARPGIDTEALAIAIDSISWSLLSEATALSKPQLERRIAAVAQLLYHAVFSDNRPARAPANTAARSDAERGSDA